MSQSRPVAWVCRKDHPFVATVVTSLSVARVPDARRRILADRFHRFRCPQCDSVEQVDVPLLYIDPERRILALVDGQGGSEDRSLRMEQFVQELEDLSGSGEGWRGLRLGGMADLREHLVAAELGIDHAALLRLLEPTEPGLSTRERARELRQRSVRHEGGRTFAQRRGRDDPEETHLREGQTCSEPGAQWTRVHPPADLPAGIRPVGREAAAARLVEAAAAAGQGALEREGLAEVLHAFCAVEPAAAELTRRERTALGALRGFAQERGWSDVALQIATLFTGLQVSRAVADEIPPADLDGFCNVLLDLPWKEAEANRELRRLDLAPVAGAAAYEWSSGTLFFGKDALRQGEEIRRRLTHEIGHSVHDAHADAVDAWLREEFGWAMYDVREDGEIDRWIAELGGWPATWPETRRARWRDMLRAGVMPAGVCDLPGQLVPPPLRPDVHQDLLASELSAAEAAGLRAVPQLLRQAQVNWFEDPDRWPSHEGRRFALNYYYGGLLSVRETTLELIAYRLAHAGKRPLGDYAAMSPMEFFAELYTVMRHRVSGFRPGPMPVERLRDGFFLHVWGRHDRAAGDKQASSWRWAMDRVKAAHVDVAGALKAEARGEDGQV